MRKIMATILLTLLLASILSVLPTSGTTGTVWEIGKSNEAVAPTLAPEMETSTCMIKWRATIDDTLTSLPFDVWLDWRAIDPEFIGWFKGVEKYRVYAVFQGHAKLEVQYVEIPEYGTWITYDITSFQTCGHFDIEYEEHYTHLDTGRTVVRTFDHDYDITPRGAEQVKSRFVCCCNIRAYPDGSRIGTLPFDGMFGYPNIEATYTCTITYYEGTTVLYERTFGPSITSFPNVMGKPGHIEYNEPTLTIFRETDVYAYRLPFQSGEVFDIYAHWSIEVFPPQMAPKIKEIIVTGFPDEKNPMTNDPSTLNEEWVKFEAKISPGQGFEVTKVSWSGDVKPGEGNPYETSYDPGTHGKKKVVCTITYKNMMTGKTGTDAKTKEFKVFFVKFPWLPVLPPKLPIADEDGDGDPNWFEYWKKALGFDFVFGVSIEYDFGVNWGKAMRTRPSVIKIGDNAGFGPEPRHSKTNIDCFYCVLTHELQHAVDLNYVIGTYGSIDTVPIANDTDKDKLPNELDPFPNAINGAGYPEYNKEKYGHPIGWVGDWEYRARQVENVVADASLDWANPGKQSDGVTASADDSIFKCNTFNTWGFGYSDPLGWADSEFTGGYSDYGVDSDSDGLYNNLTVEVEINVTAAGNCTVTGALEGDGYTLRASNHTYREVGIQNAVLNFDGSAIRRHREDGPYQISLFLDREDWINPDRTFDIYNTSAYEYTDFQRASSEFTDNYSDYGVDTDGDSLYDYLTIEVNVNAIDPGNYAIQGCLYDSNGNDITSATNSTYIGVGNHSITLNFDGLAINRHKVDGPYNLRYLSLSSESDQDDFIYDAYNTSAYSYTDFQKTDGAFTGSFSDYGKYTVGDEQYNYLTIEVGIDAGTSGNYSLVGWLHDNTGAEIAMASNSTYLDAGNQTIPLDFDGSSICNHGVDGPYDLKYLTLHDENGTLMDILDYACTTAPYNFTDFQCLHPFPPITIKADGSIDPMTAPISTIDNVTYAFTNNINNTEIDVKRSNIIVDGMEHTLDGRGSSWVGIELCGVDNVTIRNFNIQNFDYGVYCGNGSENVVSGNTITNNTYGVSIESNNNAVSENSITNNNIGIMLYSSNNTLSNNIVRDNYDGIYLNRASNNTLSGNSITDNSDYGIHLSYSSENTIYHNSYINNTIQTATEQAFNNTWHDGYPSGGNYWSDYKGVDSFWGPYQNQTGSDGIGDTTHNIDDNNQDSYPLMSPYEYWSNPISGDINKDTKVDHKDLLQLAGAYGSELGDSNWNPNADINNDDRVDHKDLLLLASNYGKGI